LRCDFAPWREAIDDEKKPFACNRAMTRAEERDDDPSLLKQAAVGDQAAWRQVLSRHEERLRRMAELRIDPRLQGRVSPSDILQETYLQAAARLEDYLRDPAAPFYFWLRGIAANKLLQAHRDHLQIEKRDARREVSVDSPAQTTSASLAAMLVAHDTRPTQAAIRNELVHRVHEALDALEPLDREVLSLRHFEQLSNAETAEILAITPAAASKRYLRALERLGAVLSPRQP
jgi:RNA polymerase sigma-70 factor, ECF subfamily